MPSPTLQISLKNTFLSFSDSPRPAFRRAQTSYVSSGTESPSVSNYSLSPLASPGQKTKVLDNYVASVGDCPQTTVMIRGIPKNYDQNMLLAEVQAVGLPVNFLYLPPGKTKTNRSYGFANFESELAAAEFLCRFEGHQWCQTNVYKVASTGFATLQGFEQNVEFFSREEVAAGVSKRVPWVKY